jgi:hypothetical protein
MAKAREINPIQTIDREDGELPAGEFMSDASESVRKMIAPIHQGIRRGFSSGTPTASRAGNANAPCGASLQT